MFGFNRHPKAVAPIVRTVNVPTRTNEDVQREARMNDYIQKAENEYARLYAETSEQLSARDAGQAYQQDTVTRQLGAMMVIADSLALLKGTDHIIEVAKLDRMGESRMNEVYPFNSFLSGTSLLYPEKTR